MADETTRLENFLKEVGHGEVRIIVMDGRLFSIPKQIIERPEKSGVRVHIVVHEPIHIKVT